MFLESEKMCRQRDVSAQACALPAGIRRRTREWNRTPEGLDPMNRAAAWAVHAFTATGLVLGAIAAVMIVRGDDAALRAALLVLLIAALIDASDGVLARIVRVSERLPDFDGRRLDDIVDFHTYTSLPLLLLWRSDALPGGLAWLLLAPLVASAYGFSQVHAKTDDGYFLGFPSYWNVVAAYVFLLRPPPWLIIVVIALLATLTFVPTKYLYPSMRGRLNRITSIAGLLWGGLLAAVLAGAVADVRTWTLVSLAFPAWYMGASWRISLRAATAAPEEAVPDVEP
jgi:phosphatidylcholine synthase